MFPVLPSTFLQLSLIVQLVSYASDENKRFAEDSPEALGCQHKVDLELLDEFKLFVT